MKYGGSMKYYMDEDTFHQIWGNDDFDSFFRNHPNVYRYPIDKKVTSKNDILESLDKKTNEKNLTLEKTQACTSTEDFNNFLQITWLELYLPRFELQYGMFEYSKSDLSASEKIEELLEYYANTCGIEDISEIPKKSFSAFKRHR